LLVKIDLFLANGENEAANYYAGVKHYYQKNFKKKKEKK
jgi:hypothetical protein